MVYSLAVLVTGLVPPGQPAHEWDEPADPLPNSRCTRCAGSLYAQGAEGLGSQRTSEASEQTICSPRFLPHVDIMDFLQAVPHGEGPTQPRQAHSMPATLDGQVNSGVDPES